jgi:beta-lactam-binding protein with PASTA domain
MDKGGGSRKAWEYVDFELEIGEGGPRRYPVSVRSPAGEAHEEMLFPFAEWELENTLLTLENTLLRSSQTRRRIPSQEEQPVQDFGRSLLQSLLVGEVRTRYAMSLLEARRQNKGLRVKLRIHPPDLARLPWEFLYDPDRDEYLSLSSKTPLVRYLDLHQPIEQLPVSPPLRILGMVSSPRDLPELDIEHEKRLVEEAIKGMRMSGLLEMTWLEGQTWSDLQEAMWGGPWHVFHFIGHGGFDEASQEGAIALADESGRKHLLGARNLARLLDDHYSLRLALLNSCEGARSSVRDAFSSTAATLVRRGVPAVVAMQYEITDRAAIAFARAFYRAVASALPVDAAVAAGRTAVSMDSALEWGTPVLYMRSPDGRIFEIAPEQRRTEPTEATEEIEDQEVLLHQYREGVESAWTGGELDRSQAEQLRDLANGLGLNQNAAGDIEREVMGDTIEAILERQEEAAKEEERRRRLEELYAQARRVHRDRRWQAVIDIFEQIRAEDANYPDREGLLASAREALEAQELEQRVAALYAEGQRHMDAEEWQQALERFEEVRRLEPGYRDTEALMSRMRRVLMLPQAVEVPDLSGQNVSEASSILDSIGLKLSVQNKLLGDTELDGLITEQSPKAGAKAAPESLVRVTVSSASLSVEVPNLLGKSRSEARSTLHLRGLMVGTIVQAPSSIVPPGRIVEQRPVAGVKVKRGDYVRIIVSSGSQDHTAADHSDQSLAGTGRRDTTEAAAVRFIMVVAVIFILLFIVSFILFVGN